MSKFTREHKLAILIYGLSLAAYAAASAGRLRSHTDDNHYVWLADGWLHGRLDLGQAPPHSNDWAEVETVWLKDGRVLRGGLVSGTQQAFRTVKGEIEQIPPEIVDKRDKKFYVSFPPFPAVVMLPVPDREPRFVE